MSQLSPKLNPGKYIIAVSGGVDSMVLLYLLKDRPEIELQVAHYNHGIRGDSDKDEKLVLATAKKYRLAVEVERGKLGPKTSEAAARRARYGFLDRVKRKHQADSIITAHHQDDLLETALLNILRGTGRRGLSAISDNPDVIRPLLHIPKKRIMAYAAQNKIKWREDLTNREDAYLRNYIRNQILINLTSAQRVKLLKNIEKVAKSNKGIDQIIATISHKFMIDGEIDREVFIGLPPQVANELIMYWLRQENFEAYDKPMVERLSLAIKTARSKTRHKISGNFEMVVGRKSAHFERK